MKLTPIVQQLYLAMSVSELRYANLSPFQKVTYTSLLYLDIIRSKENCTVSYLAQVLGIARSAVTIKVKELTRLGLVLKEQSAEDKRVFYLRLNAELTEEYRIFDNEMNDIEHKIRQQYSDKDVDLFTKMLGSIVELISE